MNDDWEEIERDRRAGPRMLAIVIILAFIILLTVAGVIIF